MLDIIHIINFIKDYGYIGIFLIIFFECSIFFALPGDSLLFTVGILASKGYLNIYTAIFVIIISSILGSNFGYFIGKYLDRFSKNKYFLKIIKVEKLELVKDYFQKHGYKTLLFAKFIPIVRTFAPMFCGFSKLDFKTFNRYNIFGSLIWGSSLTFLAYFLGEEFPSLEKNITTIVFVILIISVTPFIVKFIKKYFTKTS